MPTFLSRVAVYFYKLFEDGTGTTGAFFSEAGGVVETAVYAAVVFVVAVLWAKQGRTKGASEVFDVVFFV